MDKENEVLKNRTEKILNWFKDPYNFTLFTIIALAVIIRIYYFILTKNQALWWDEADFMMIAKRFAFGESYTFGAVRPIFLSVISAILFRIYNSEFLPRLLLFVLSIASVIGAYLLGARMYNKRVGLISSFFITIFYLIIFFTYRLIVDVPSLAFFIFSAYFFYRYFDERKNKFIYIAAVLIAIGTLFKQSTAFFLPAIFIYVLITEKLSCFKKKEYYIASLIFFLILAPYIIWGFQEYHGFVLTRGTAEVAPSAGRNYFTRGLEGARDYIFLLPSYFVSITQANFLFWLITLIIILGLIIVYFLKLFLGFDIMIKNPEEKSLKKDLFLLLMIVIPFLFASSMINHNEDRYILNSLAGLMILFSVLLDRLYLMIRSKSKILGIIIMISLMILIASIQLKSADNLTRSKIPSYAEIREAGLWMKANSNPGDMIISSSPMQIRYYSGRETIDIPHTVEEFANVTSTNSPRYFMLSSYEIYQTQIFSAWSITYPAENNWTIAQAYFADAERTQPMVIIYEIPKGFDPNAKKVSSEAPKKFASVNSTSKTNSTNLSSKTNSSVNVTS